MVTAGASTFRLDDSGGGFVVVMARWSSDRRAGSPVPIRDTGGHGWRGHGVAWRCEFGSNLARSLPSFGRLDACAPVTMSKSLSVVGRTYHENIGRLARIEFQVQVETVCRPLVWILSGVGGWNDGSCPKISRWRLFRPVSGMDVRLDEIIGA